MLLQNKKVAIVGGGPGGLTLAKLHQLKGVDVKVYERSKDKSAVQQGATLDLHYESGLKALRECGLMEEFEKKYRPGADRLTITDQHAVVRFGEAEEGRIQDLNSEYARPEIDRGPLRDLLIESLQDKTIVWNAHCAELKKEGSRWELIFKNGTVADADFVIAADGANSKIRKYITNIQPVYSGITVLEGNIYNAAVNAPHLWELTNGGKVFALGGSKTIVLSAKGEGSLSFYTGTRETKDWVKTSGIDFENKEQILAWFKQRFSDWSVNWQKVFLTDESYFVARPQYYFPVDQAWQLYEALCMGDFSSLQEAIAAFEKKMCSRTSEVTVDTLLQTEALHSEDSLQYLLDMFNHFRS